MAQYISLLFCLNGDTATAEKVAKVRKASPFVDTLQCPGTVMPWACKYHTAGLSH